MVLTAFVPILVPVAMVAFGRPSIHAAVLGVLSAVVVSVVWFPIPVTELPGAAQTWGPLLVEFVLIIAGGLLLSEANRLTGRQALLSDWLERSVGSGVGAALICVHGVTPFAESLTGFGLGVTVAIPLLVRLGFGSKQAVAIGLLGLCAVPWGSMGPGTLIAAQLAGIDFRELGIASAIASGPVFLAVGIVAALVASKKEERCRALVAASSSALLLWSAVTAANLVFGTAPAGAIGALLTLLVHVVFYRLKGQDVSMDWSHRRGLTGYAILLGGVLLGTAGVWVLGMADGPAKYLASPAPWLFLATAFIVPRHHVREVVTNGLKKWIHAGPVNVVFVVLGIIMAETGMATAIANAVATLGPMYMFALPFVAGAGGYLTGSNSAANAMFAVPHAHIATALDLPLLPAMGAHNVASSLFMMSSPGKVELAAQLSGNPDAGRQALSQIAATILVVAAALGAGLTVIRLC